MKKTDDEILIQTMEVLARDIQSDNKIVNEIIKNAAQRLRELKNERDGFLEIIKSYNYFGKNELIEDWIKLFDKATKEIDKSKYPKIPKKTLF